MNCNKIVLHLDQLTTIDSQPPDYTLSLSLCFFLHRYFFFCFWLMASHASHLSSSLPPPSRLSYEPILLTLITQL